MTLDIQNLSRDQLMASARIYRVVADPEFTEDSGTGLLQLQATFSDIGDEQVIDIVDLLVDEGSIEWRGGMLFPVAYEEEP